MGLEIRRVPLGFDWPRGEVWGGYLMPESLSPERCASCDGTGHNRETLRLADAFFGAAPGGRGWSAELIQEEVDLLVARGRLVEMTHDWTPGSGWTPRPGARPTAERVNRAERTARMGIHDGINRLILLEARARRLGVWGLCPVCGGRAILFRDAAHAAAHAAWRPAAPPSGEGWQVWETLTEGSPSSPVFATADELVEWLCGAGHTERAAREFVAEGWAPTAIADAGGVHFDIDAREAVLAREDRARHPRPTSRRGR